MGSWDKVNGKKVKKSPKERDEEISEWIGAQQKIEVSPINLVVYGKDGTCKTGACMDIRSEEEMDKKVFVIDVDGSAAPIREEYWGGDENIMIVDPIEITEEGDISWVESYNRILDACKWLRKHEMELNLKGVVLDGLDTLLKICVAGDTIIYPKALPPMKISEYVETGMTVPIMTRNGYEVPLQTFKLKSQLIRIGYTSGDEICVTPDHPLLGTREYWDKPKFIPASKLNVGMRLAETIYGPQVSCYDYPAKKAKFIGMLIAEGSMTQHYSPKISNNKVEPMELVLKESFPECYLKPISSNQFSINFKGNKDGGTYKNPMRTELEQLKLWDTYSHTKFIPDVIKYGSIETISAFFDGYIFGDGWQTKTKVGKRTGMYTVSHQLAEDLRFILWRLGKRTTLYVNRYHNEVGSDKLFSNYQARIGYGISVDEPEIANIRDDVRLKHISSVEKISGLHDVYDLRMPSGNFIANRIVNHNCEYKMKIEDLKVNPSSRITDLFSWHLRNSAFLLVVKLIKGLKCDRLYTTHLKELKGWVQEAKGKTLAVTGYIPEWEKSTPNLMFQKLSAERIVRGKVVEWKVKVEKSKTNSALEGKEYVVLKVDHSKSEPEVEWNGIKEFLAECRHKEVKE